MADFKKFSKKKVLGPMRRCLDPEAVENIGLRRLCRRIKSIIGHFPDRADVCDSLGAPPEYSRCSQPSTSTSQMTACLASRLPIQPPASHVSVKQILSPANTFTTSLRVPSHPLCTPAPGSVSKERFSVTPQTHTAQARLRGRDFFQGFPSDLLWDLLPPDIWTSSQATYDLSITYPNINIIYPVKGFRRHCRNEGDSVKTHDTVSLKKPVTDFGGKNAIVATTDVSYELNDNDESSSSGPEVWFNAVDISIETANVTTSSGYSNATTCCTI